MLGIRNILVRIRIRTSDKWIRIQLRIRLFSSVTLRMQKKVLLFFSCNLPAGTLSSVKILFYKLYYRPLNTFMSKGKAPDPDPDLYLRLMDPDPGGSITWGTWIRIADGNKPQRNKNGVSTRVTKKYCLPCRRWRRHAGAACPTTSPCRSV